MKKSKCERCKEDGLTPNPAVEVVEGPYGPYAICEDHKICPKCKYENARCACVKWPKREMTPEDRERYLRTFEEIKKIVRERS